MRKTGLITALFALALTGCSGTDDGAFTGGNGPANSSVASVTVITDTPTIPSNGLTAANISVLVRDDNNRFIAGVPVQISASSGGLAVTTPVTDENGIAHATLLPAGDPSNRVITVTGSASGHSGQTTVAVSGTTVAIQGPDSLVTNTAGNYEAVIVSSGGSPVANQVVTLTSQPAATFSAASVTTDANGRAAFTMTPTSGASVTITASAAGSTTTKTVVVSADNFSFTSPAADTAFGLAPTSATLTTMWSSGGTPVSTGTVTFSTTRGSIVGPTSATPAGGQASVVVQSNTAGEAVVTALNSNGGSTQRRIVFVAANAATLDLQANPFTVGISQSSTLTAVVRDANNNLVAGKNVVFSLSDPTGGSLSVGSAVTDAQGRASTVYRASTITSANNGIHVTALVPSTPATDTVDLTVSGAPLFLSFGTGNNIEEVNPSQYKIDYTVQVTDSNGAGVAGVSVSLSALSWNYIKGSRFVPPGATSWSTRSSTLPAFPSCWNEDRLTGNASFDFNGILDSGEDENGNGTMQSGNIATIVPGSGTTDANGFLQFSIYYPQDHAYYLEIVLRARTAVQGTEFTRQTLPFVLPGAAPDFNNVNNAPPGMTSPFGVGTSCSDPN